MWNTHILSLQGFNLGDSKENLILLPISPFCPPTTQNPHSTHSFTLQMLHSKIPKSYFSRVCILMHHCGSGHNYTFVYLQLVSLPESYPEAVLLLCFGVRADTGNSDLSEDDTKGNLKKNQRYQSCK
ncbi:hypothetical protein J6590_048750 [Homalodisca vitripennis]|nr:hypothetical protein J6590_048750 [Homalodisca vitripennis]